MMKLLVLTPVIILAVFVSAFVFQTAVTAVDVLDPVCSINGEPSVCDRDQSQTSNDNVLVGPDGMITRVTQVLVWISGALAMMLIIIAGFMFMFSAGNPANVSRARSAIL